MIHNIMVNGVESNEKTFVRKPLNVIITADKIGKTISINNGKIQFSIPFEQIEKYLK